MTGKKTPPGGTPSTDQDSHDFAEHYDGVFNIPTGPQGEPLGGDTWRIEPVFKMPEQPAPPRPKDNK